MNKRSAYTTGVMLGITGILMFSSKAVLVRMAYQYNITPIPLMVLRMGFALPIYAVLALVQRPKDRKALRPIHYLGLVASGVLGYYLASYLDFIGLQFVKASLERLLLFSYPIMVLLINRLVYGEVLNRNQYIAIGLTYLGMVITFIPEVEGLQDGVIWGAVAILGSALAYAMYLVGSGRLIPRFGTGPFTSYCMLVSCSCVLLHFGLTEQESILQYPTPVYWLGLTMAVVATVVPSYLISAAIRRLGSSTFSAFASLGPVSTILLAYIFLGERLNVFQWMGAVVVIGGVWLLSRKGKQKVAVAKN